MTRYLQDRPHEVALLYRKDHAKAGRFPSPQLEIRAATNSETGLDVRGREHTRKHK